MHQSRQQNRRSGVVNVGSLTHLFQRSLQRGDGMSTHVQNCVRLTGDGSRVDDFGNGLQNRSQFFRSDSASAIQFDVGFDPDALGSGVDLNGKSANSAGINEPVDASLYGARGKPNDVPDVGIPGPRVIAELFDDAAVSCVHDLILKGLPRQKRPSRRNHAFRATCE